jgi:hypothetical protein
MLAMPIVVINMGVEMLYILEQRLSTQNMPESKLRRVLGDVIRSMFNESFIEELFKPQVVYSAESTRQIFDRLAHSSIMKLNKVLITTTCLAEGERKRAGSSWGVTRGVFAPACVFYKMFSPTNISWTHAAAFLFSSKNSMDKLYDLMVMEFKFQVLSCVSPDEIYAVTARHLHRAGATVRERERERGGGGGGTRLRLREIIPSQICHGLLVCV